MNLALLLPLLLATSAHPDPARGARLFQRLDCTNCHVAGGNGPDLSSEGTRAHDAKWLAVQIEIACIRLGFNSNTKLINETRAWILRQPELWQDRSPQSGVRP